MKFRFLMVRGQSIGPDMATKDRRILQVKPDGGVWEDVPEVEAELVRRMEAEAAVIQEIAIAVGATPTMVEKIIDVLNAKAAKLKV